MSHTELSVAENAGWRYSWDGWAICPACLAKKGYTPETWRVPATYDTPIKAPQKCADCCIEAPVDAPLLTPAARTPQADEYTRPDC